MEHEVSILNPAELLKILDFTEVIHWDGAKGVILGTGFRPDYALVRFTDGVESSKSFSSLRVSGLVPTAKYGLKVLTLRIATPAQKVRPDRKRNVERFLTEHQFVKAATEFRARVLEVLASVAKVSAFEAVEFYDRLCEVVCNFNEGTAETLYHAIEATPQLGSLSESYALVHVLVMKELQALSQKTGLIVPDLSECLPLLAREGYKLQVEDRVRDFLESRIQKALAEGNVRKAIKTYINNSQYVDDRWFNNSVSETSDKMRRTILQEIEEGLKNNNYVGVSVYQAKAERLGLNLDLNGYHRIEQELEAIEKLKNAEDWSAIVEMRSAIKSDISRLRLGQVINNQVRILQNKVEVGFSERNPHSILQCIEYLAIFGDTKFIRERLTKAKPKWEHEKRIEDLRSQLSQFQLEFQALRFTPCFKQPDLDDLSAQLILDWAEYPVGHNESHSNVVYQQCLDRNHRISQMWSARSAEIVSLDYWKAMHHRVTDISIHQITKESSSWKGYDLELDGLYIDVKNARTSFSSKKNYSDICVPRFKAHRSMGAQVLIQGVFSEYIRPEAMASEEADAKNITILGLVSRSDIHDLEESIARITQGKVSIQTLQRNNRPHKFLPGWLFEQPKGLYKAPDHNQERYLQFLTAWKAVGLSLQDIPVPILLIAHANESSHVGLDLFRINSYAVEIITRVIREHGLKLRSIVMGVILACIRCKRLDALEFSPKDLKRLFFLNPDGKSLDFPLGVYDPLEYVNSFISVFEMIYEKNRTALAAYDRFKLQGANILMGSSAESLDWDTIIAYCGGMNPKFHVACGKNPIFLGESVHCEQCRRLICPDCGFCAEQCEERLTREKKSAPPEELEEDLPF